MAKGNGPIQYNELFNVDVNAKLIELDGVVNKLDSDFQELAATIASMGGKISVNIKANNTALKNMSDSLNKVDVSTRGAGEAMTEYAKVIDIGIKKSNSLKSQVIELKNQENQLTVAYVNSKAALDEKRKTIISNSQAEVDAYQKSKKGQEGIITTVTNRNKAEGQAANDATARSAKALANSQKQAAEYVRAQGLIEKLQIKLVGYKLAQTQATDPRVLEIYNSKIQSTEKLIGQLSNAGKQGFDSLGNAVKNSGNFITNAGQKLVTLARLLPGIGFVGIIAFATEPILEYIKTLDLFKGKINTAAENLKNLNDVFKDANKDAGTQITNLKFLYQSTTDVNNSMKARIDAARELQKEFPTTFGLQTKENIINGEASGIYNQLTSDILTNARAKAAAAKVSDIAAKQLDEDFQQQKIRIAQSNELLKSQKDEANGAFAGIPGEGGGGILAGENERKIKERADNAIKLSNIRKKSLQDQADFLIKFIGGNNKIAAALGSGDGGKADEKAMEKSEAERAAAARKALKDADDLLKAQTKLNIAKLESKEIADLAAAGEGQETAIIIQFEKDKLKVIEEGIAAREKLYKKGTAKFIELEAEKAQAGVDAQEKIAKATEDALKRQLALQEKYKKLRDDILNSESRGAQASAEFSVTSKTYKGSESDQDAQKEQALYDLRRGALIKELLLVDVRNSKIKDSVERELTSAKEKQDIINDIAELGYRDFERLQEKQKAKLEEIFSYLRDNNQLIGEFYGQEFGNLFDSLTTNLENMVKGTGNTIADWAETIKAGVGAAADVFKQGSEARIADLEKEKQTQMDIAGSNSTARLAIEKAFNDKIKAEKIKQAKIDKATAIFDIVINTAVAASKATAQAGIFGLPLAAVLIAFGAIQAGLVAARPLPAFRTGTQNAPEGYAEVAEDGPELIQGKRGLRVAYKRQVTYLEQGDKVFTAAQTRKILDTSAIDSNTELHGRLANNLHQQSSEQRIREMSIAFRQDPDAIGEAVGRRIKDLPIHQTYFDERGVSRYIRQNGTTTKYLNDRTSLK